MKNEKMWAMLLHLGSNMWTDSDDPRTKDEEDFAYRTEMLCDKETWIKVTEFMAKEGFNTLFIDIGEGVLFDSHPEIATKGAWTKNELRADLERLRSLGITPLPKFNFSPCHSAWMGDWAFKLGLPEYYEFCKILFAAGAAA